VKQHQDFNQYQVVFLRHKTCMIMKQVIYLVISACLLLYSCSKDDKKRLALSESNIAFTSVGGEKEITVTANTGWGAKHEADWIHVEINGNIGNGTILIDVQPNYLTAERSARIYVTTLSGGIVEEITVSQEKHVDTPFQIYDDDWTPFKGNIDLVGKPIIPLTNFNSLLHLPFATSSPTEIPWEINGYVNGGIMAIDFPNEKLELTSEYKRASESVAIGRVYIEQRNNRNLKIGLFNKNILDNHVIIIYTSDDFSSEVVTFKSGWNFVEIVRNPDWIFGNNEPFYLFGLISQSVQLFLEKGYRWRLDHWAYGLPWP